MRVMRNVMITELHPGRVKATRVWAAFTIIELLFGLAILAAGGVIILKLLSKSTRISKESSEVTIATYLARDLLDEAISRNFRDPQLVGFPADVSYDNIGVEMNAASLGYDDLNADAAVARENYDDCDDYNGYTENPPRDVIYAVNMTTGVREAIRYDGTSYDIDGDGVTDLTTPDLSKYTRTVAVQFVDDNDYTVLRGANPSDSKIIVVTVHWPDQKARPVNSVTLAYTTPSDPQAIYVRMVTLTAVKTDFDQ